MTNILLIWDRMGDYHRARWFELQKLHTNGLVFAADLGSGDNLYQWENTKQDPNYILFSSKKLDQFDFFKRISCFIKTINQNQIKIVCIPGYGRIEYIAMLIIAKLKKKKIVLLAESWYPGNYFIDKLKGLFLRLVCDSYLVSGEKALLHFHHRLGISSKKISKGYSVVDNLHFLNCTNKSTSSKVLLCIARFAPEKNLELLIRAFINSKLPSNNWILRIVGGGALHLQLDELSKNQPIELKKWLSYKELPDMYQQANCFILPSIFEPWGLVVNEAMASCLPIIISTQCGCYPDLLSNANGWSFDANNQNELENVFHILSEKTNEQLIEMGKKSVSIIENFSTKQWAQSILTSYSL